MNLLGVVIAALVLIIHHSEYSLITVTVSLSTYARFNSPWLHHGIGSLVWIDCSDNDCTVHILLTHSLYQTLSSSNSEIFSPLITCLLSLGFGLFLI